MKYGLTVMLWLVAFSAVADEIFPAKCHPLMVHEDLLTLSAKKPSVVMIHNLSSIDLWLTHPISEPSASAGWSSRIQGGHWSALALDKASFDLSCIESRPGHEQQVPCKGLLAACIWPSVKSPKSKSGTFWAGEDLPLSALKAHVGSRGFVLP
ncbi:MAG: hypothetical protein NTW94_09500 [Legionellales bacterium]|nr:hypothetical protein [Legionellales bacterium]